MNQENPSAPEPPEPSAASPSEIIPESQKPPVQEFPHEKEINLNELYPDSEMDLNALFPEGEMKHFLKRVSKNKKDLHQLRERFTQESALSDEAKDDLDEDPLEASEEESIPS